MKFRIFLVILSLIFIGCGGGGGGSSNNSATKKTLGTAELGRLSNADVTIYKIENNGILTKLWNEKTTSSNKLELIGLFDTHSDDLDDNAFYLYKVSGGYDCDYNDDGELDDAFIANKGVIRLIAKGSDIKAVGNNLKITYASELVYESIVKNLKYNFDKNNLENLIDNAAKNIVKDIDGNGVVNNKDILEFDAIKNKENLTDIYKLKRDEIIKMIHAGKIPALSVSAVISSYNFISPIKSIAISKNNDKLFLLTYNEINLTNPSTILNVVDITNKEEPKILKQMDLNGSISYMKLSNNENNIYLADDSNDTFEILDISNLDNPQIISKYDLNISNGDIVNFAISNDDSTAFIADGNDSLYILDISNLSNPTLIKHYEINGSVDSVLISNDNKIAYLIDTKNGKLHFLDVKDVSNPINLSDYDVNASAIVLSKDNDVLYVSDSLHNKLDVLDLSNISNPNLVNEYNLLSSANGIVLSNDGNKLFITGGNNGIEILDISDNFNPKLLNTYHLYASDIVLSNDDKIAYVANNNALSEIDISNVKDKVLFKNDAVINSYDINTSTVSVSISKNNKIEYVAGYNKFFILNLNNFNPSLRSYYEINGSIVNFVLSSDEQVAYIANDINDSLNILDLIDKDNPKLASRFDLNASKGVAVDVKVSSDNKIAFVADSNDGLYVLDVSDIYNPQLLSHYEINGSAVSIALSNDNTTLFVANNIYGKIEILDVSDVSNPTLITDYEVNLSTGLIGSIKLSHDENYLYVSVGKGVYILDVSDVNNPQLVSRIPLVNGFVKNMTLSSNDKTLYIANDIGISVIDVSVPKYPQLMGTYDTNSWADDICLSNDKERAYVVGRNKFIDILDLNLFNFY
jgi:hypothetical protein